LSRAGTVELAASIIVFAVIITNLVLVMGHYATQNHSIKMLEIENPTDIVQAFIENHAYMDPNSGNTYHIISYERNLTFNEDLNANHLRDVSFTLHLPILIFSDNLFSISVVEIKGAL